MNLTTRFVAIIKSYDNTIIKEEDFIDHPSRGEIKKLLECYPQQSYVVIETRYIKY